MAERAPLSPSPLLCLLSDFLKGEARVVSDDPAELRRGLQANAALAGKLPPQLTPLGGWLENPTVLAHTLHACLHTLGVSLPGSHRPILSSWASRQRTLREEPCLS